MTFVQTCVQGAFIIDLERRTDQRGYFARAWCRHEFEAHGLTARIAQVNVSRNALKGTVRGMHFQVNVPEAKVISCTRGSIHDVVLDLRSNSPTYLFWAAVRLTAENRRMLYLPEGVAHGFQTLADDTELMYFMSEFYVPEYARGVRYDDPAFGIVWPLPVASISDADRTWPDFEIPARSGIEK
jgi:dTDP-4-dehydrorhamnose 3,5-epimerase